MYRHELLQKSRRNKKGDMGDMVTLVDFTCHIEPDQYFHLIADCVVPVSGLLAPMVEAALDHTVHALVPDYLHRFWPWFDRALQASDTKYTLIRGNTSTLANRSEYFDVHSQMLISYYLIQWGWPVEPLKEYQAFLKRDPRGDKGRSLCKRCLRNLAYEAEGVVSDEGVSSNALAAPCKSLVYVSRATTRVILTEKPLLSHLQRAASSNRLSFIVLFGNESISSVVQVYSQACAVVAYHGAGAVNAIFGRPNMLVLEINTYKGPSAWTSLESADVLTWRSNKRAVLEGLGFDLEWSVYHVEYTYLAPPPNETLYPGSQSGIILDTGSNWAEYLKDRNIVLDRQHIHNIAEVTRLYLHTHTQDT
jgi:hypothetical protein